MEQQMEHNEHKEESEPRIKHRNSGETIKIKKKPLIISLTIFIVILLVLIAYNLGLFSTGNIVQGTSSTTSSTPRAVQTSVSGKVANYVTQKPLANIDVAVNTAVGKTDADGVFTIAVDENGSYEIKVNQTGYLAYAKKLETASPDKKEIVQLVPEGRIVYVSNRDGKKAIYTANYDGSEEKMLVARVGASEDYNTIISPHERIVGFLSTRTGRKDKTSQYDIPSLYSVKIDGTDFQKISDDYSISNITWSPDGTYLTWMGREKEDSSTTTSFSVFNAATKTYKRINPDTNSSLNYSIAFKADDSLMAYSQYSNDGQLVGVYVSKPDSSEKRRVLDKSASTIKFNTDGNLEMSYWESGSQKLKAWFADSGVTQDISQLSKATKGIKSPNKNKIAYVEERDGKRDVFSAKPDETEEKRLTNIGKAESVTGWSKNSEYVIFRISSSDERARYIVSAAGEGEARKIVDETYGGEGYY